MVQQKLKKSLNLTDVIAFGIGPMLSSGIFLLPGMVFAKVGPTAILAYLAAGLLIIPSLLSKAELATAMPRAGGTYYFLDRSMGPLLGTISGLGTWMSLVFKSAFDLIGLGAYLVLIMDLPAKPVAIALCIVFAVLSISGIKNVGRFQGIFVAILLGLMGFFIGKGIFVSDPAQYKNFLNLGNESFLGAIGFVYVSFAGLTKIASVAEEVEDLERNIPLGMILALAITLIIYVLGMIVIIGVMPADQLSHSLTPVVDAAQHFMGPVGSWAMTGAAILAFVASANAGITAASRYPLAMSRDNLIPEYWKKIGRFHSPTRSIILTMALMVLFILILSPESIAKLGSAFKLLIFGMINLAVIVMRESKITAYDPGFRSPLYPWMQIIGIATPIVLIPELGILPMILSAGVIVTGTLWYYLYAVKKVNRSAAMYQWFERVGSASTPSLDRELRQMMREKGLRKEDPFEQSILRANVLKHEAGEDEQAILKRACAALADRLEIDKEIIYEQISSIYQLGETPIGDHVALPHARLDEVETTELAIVYSSEGITFGGAEEPIYVLFVLVSPKENPRQHLRFLAELANRAENVDFAGSWRQLETDEEIRNNFLRSGDIKEIMVLDDKMVGMEIRELPLSPDCLVALIRREDKMIVPHGNTILREGDHITIVGKEEAVLDAISYFETKS